MQMKHKLFAFGGLSVAMVAGGAFVASVVEHRMQDLNKQSAMVVSALKNHLEGDMMHDALRADVLAAMLAGRKGDVEARKSIEADLREHTNWFRRMLEENAKLPLDKTTQGALVEVKPALDKYIAAAEQMVPQAFAEPAKADQSWPVFAAAFEELEGQMAAVSERIEKAAADTAAMADEGTGAHRPIMRGDGR